MSSKLGSRVARCLSRFSFSVPSCHVRLTTLAFGVRASRQEAGMPRKRIPYVPSRANSTTISPKSNPEAADEIAQDMLSRYRETAIIRSQILDANQLQKLCITLNRPNITPDQDMTKAPPEQGTAIPPGYHLVYFTPSDLESDLGPDGTDQPFAPGRPFTRRMWAGGRVRWYPDNPLRIGDNVTESTRLLNVVPKTSKHGGNTMLIATVEKVFSTEKGPAVRETRTWVFLKPPAQPSTTDNTRQLTQKIPHMNSSVSEYEAQSGSSFLRRRLQWSAKALFRFSALTFNAHMIHLNPDWCRDIEGLPGLVVHGPLNLINMMDYWRDVHGQSGKLQPLEVSYRAISPLFVREESVMSTESVREADDESGAGKAIYKIRLSKRRNEGEGSFDPENLLTVMEGEIRAGH